MLEIPCVRRAREDELEQIQRVVSVAFGQHLGMPEPADFGNGACFSNRWYLDPQAVFVSEDGGKIIGVAFAAVWGSFGTFGPVCVDPGYWDKGVGQPLIKAVLEYLRGKRVTHSGIFTFANSVKHISLYQKYGFCPRFLTAIMKKPTIAKLVSSAVVQKSSQLHKEPDWYLLSGLVTVSRIQKIDQLRRLTNLIYAGLDLSSEIGLVSARKIGDVLIVPAKNDATSDIDAFAICHFGAGSEAERNGLYIKFAAARPGASQAFRALIVACESLARSKQLQTMTAGVNTACTSAYTILQEQEFKPVTFGIAMQKPNEHGFCQAESLVINDWR